jgi:transcriptional regulator with XRE-family HTH domain
VLLERREACGFSQTKLAELSGLTRQMISFVEQSRRIPTVDTLARLAGALGVQPSAILSEAEKRAAK